MARESDVVHWSFLALLAGGVLIFAGGLATAAMMGTGTSRWAMGAYLPPITGSWVLWWMGAWSAFTGLFVLLAALKVAHGARIGVWGFIGIVAGSASLLSMGGYLIGAFAAILGGALAIIGGGAPGAPRRPAGRRLPPAG